ncbi:helix-turn-helix domain-containing protein [Planctomycetota bacterium]|nr:helix-turn-helix domain-containing protein [Planctomycetota bacterium]
MDTKRKEQAEKLLWTVKDLAISLGVSQSHIYRMKNKGLLPKPSRIGGVVRWSVQEVKAWIDAGTPNMLRWNEMKGGAA